MTREAMNVQLVNPFSTTFVRPGAIPFLFSAGVGMADLVTQLETQDWWGQIIGPHGTGKSTLLAGLMQALATAGREPLWYAFRDGVISLPSFRAEQLGLHPEAVLVIDGYEQLGSWQRWRLCRACRRSACGLVVTAHYPVGLPGLYNTSVDADMAQRVLSHLNREGTSNVSPEDLVQCLTIRKGNLREALFDLYDLHERRVRHK